MNVSVENLAPCKKLVRIELDIPTVDAAFEDVTNQFVKHARLPGFRPGKSPRHLVIKAYAAEIDNEVRRKLISESYRDAVREQKLDVVGQPDVEEVQFGRGQPLMFTANLETAPEFELPDYKGLPLKLELRTVTEEDIDRAIDILREQRATYMDLDRVVQADDYVVVNYTGTCDGKPITDLAPTAKGLTEKKDFWVHVRPDSFIPGFADQLVGAKAGDKKTVTVDFPADFVAPQVAGKQGVYEVEVVQVKEKTMPEVTEEFAKAFGAESVEALRVGVRNDLEQELSYKIQRSTREQLMRGLLSRVTCELPESVVQNETRNVVYDIVRENQERGVSRETIDQQKDQIFSAANSSARERVKAAFVLNRIAEKEGIKVEDKEVEHRVAVLSQQYQISPQKLIKQLEERNGFAEIREQIMSSKVVAFLEKHAQVEEVLPPGGTPAAG